jgi:hypothetical protein
MAFVFDPLAAFEKAAVARREANARYTPALLRAFDELIRAGEPHPYVMLAKLAGVSRQAIREHVGRASEARRPKWAPTFSDEGYDLAAEVEAGRLT